MSSVRGKIRHERFERRVCSFHSVQRNFQDTRIPRNRQSKFDLEREHLVYWCRLHNLHQTEFARIARRAEPIIFDDIIYVPQFTNQGCWNCVQKHCQILMPPHGKTRPVTPRTWASCVRKPKQSLPAGVSGFRTVRSPAINLYSCVFMQSMCRHHSFHCLLRIFVAICTIQKYVATKTSNSKKGSLNRGV